METDLKSCVWNHRFLSAHGMTFQWHEWSSGPKTFLQLQILLCSGTYCPASWNGWIHVAEIGWPSAERWFGPSLHSDADQGLLGSEFDFSGSWLQLKFPLGMWLGALVPPGDESEGVPEPGFDHEQLCWLLLASSVWWRSCFNVIWSGDLYIVQHWFWCVPRSV